MPLLQAHVVPGPCDRLAALRALVLAAEAKRVEEGARITALRLRIMAGVPRLHNTACRMFQGRSS